MLCQRCYRAQATYHVLDRPSDEGLVESHYCLACYERRYGHPPADNDPPEPARPPAFPLARFSIGHLMILAGLFGLLNASVVLIMRTGARPGPPGELDRWTIRAVLFANLFCSVLALETLAIVWLARMRWYRMTCHWVPLTQMTQMKVERLLAERDGGAIGPWTGASAGERLIHVAQVLWVLACFCWLTPMRLQAWLPVYPFESVLSWVLIVNGGTILLCLGLVALTRRRPA